MYLFPAYRHALLGALLAATALGAPAALAADYYEPGYRPVPFRERAAPRQRVQHEPRAYRQPRARAEAGCGANCYRRVNHPARYRSVEQTVQLSPARTTHVRLPAETVAVSETVQVSPGYSVPRHVPATYGQVAEKVVLSPGGKRWQVSHDAHGREVGCWVHEPATYATQHRTVELSPARVVHESVAPTYGVRQRHVTLAPERLVASTTPPTYGSVVRHKLIAPARSGWEPIGGQYKRERSLGFMPGSEFGATANGPRAAYATPY